MARVTHIAVNLLLIVAVTMQPGLTYGIQRGCSSGVSAGLMCGGCGCCEVRSETARCPCCIGKATQEDDGCCGDDRQNRDHAATSAEDPVAGAELKNGTTPEEVADAKQRSSDRVPQAQADEIVALAADCPCVTAPRPIDAQVPRSPATELREVLTVDVARIGDGPEFERPPLSGAFEFARRPMVHCSSQIAYCVWRL